jgi:ADP-ribose pyrophosphatase
MRSNKATSSDRIEKTLSRREIYRGRSFSFYSDDVLLPNGKRTKKDYVKYPEAAAIVPFLDKENIILIRQFRYAVGKTIYEIPAGKFDDPKENKAKAAKRELLEETGYESGKMKYLFSYYPCAGYSTEMIHIFRADGLVLKEQMPDEDEFIRTEIVSYKKALDWVRGGKIVDSKTILALLYLKTFLPEK